MKAKMGFSVTPNGGCVKGQGLREERGMSYELDVHEGGSATFLF